MPRRKPATVQEIPAGALVRFLRNKCTSAVPYSVGDVAFLSEDDTRLLLGMGAVELVADKKIEKKRPT